MPQAVQSHHAPERERVTRAVAARLLPLPARVARLRPAPPRASSRRLAADVIVHWRVTHAAPPATPNQSEVRTQLLRRKREWRRAQSMAGTVALADTRTSGQRCDPAGCVSGWGLAQVPPPLRGPVGGTWVRLEGWTFWNWSPVAVPVSGSNTNKCLTRES